ncbi:MAG: SirB2 family protein [Sulfuricaulis sp.]
MILKYIHVASALLSISGYLMRGVWMMRESPRLQQTWVKVVPHIVDSILIVSAILLAIQVRQYPFVQAWLTAKVFALIAYVVVGAIGLKYGATKKIRIAAWLSAIAIFAYIFLVAVSRQVLPFVG